MFQNFKQDWWTKKGEKYALSIIGMNKEASL